MYDPLPSSRRRALRLWMLAFAGPALGALAPNIVPRKLLPKAIALSSTPQGSRT